MKEKNTPQPEPEISDSSAETAAEEYAVLEVFEEAEAVPTPTPNVPPSAYAVVGGNDQDHVYLSRCLYKNLTRKKSLSVHHIQRRLHEWGYSEAYLDKDGYYGDHTQTAVKKFQEDHGLDGDGSMDSKTLMAIFEGDTNVMVIID